MSYRSLQQARVLITGATSGIGRELARQLYAENCRLILTGRRENRLNELAEELASSPHDDAPLIVPGDLCDPGIRRQLIDIAKDQLDGLDILINNAGVGAVGPFATATEDRMRQVMEVNFFAAVELTRLAIPVLRQGRQPLIVNVGSVLGHRAVPLKSEYCASKFALHGWSDALRAELACRPSPSQSCRQTGTASALDQTETIDRPPDEPTFQQIDVLLVSPSTTATDFFDSVLEDSTGTANQHQLSSPQSPGHVAARTVRAMQRGKHEIILTWTGNALVWLDRLCPPLANRMIARFGKS